MVEYVLLIALIAIGALVAIATVGTTLRNKFQPSPDVLLGGGDFSTRPRVVSPTPSSTSFNLSTDPGLRFPIASPELKKDEETRMAKYSGSLLAGSIAPLLDFTQADFDAAARSGNVIVLYFYANWCPICAEEFPKMQSAFNELSTDGVVGFRVNFNDNKTDADEQALAREHGVAYQHTKVLLKNGKQVLKSPETWDSDRYLTEISNARGQ